MKYILPLLIALSLFSAPPAAEAGPSVVPEKVRAVMIGDRLIDIALSLGVLPEGMSLRCSLWPRCEAVKLASQVLGCPNCVLKKEPEKLVNFLKERGITRLILEKNPDFCRYKKIDPTEAAAVVKDIPGVVVEYVDFSRGVVSAVRQTAELLNRKDKAAQVIASYEKAMAKAKKAADEPRKGKRVVILNGQYSDQTGKVFVRVEAPGGYSDTFFLEPLGCENVGQALISETAAVSKGHVMSRRLGGLLEARPDVIVMTGDAYAVQKRIREAVGRQPELAEVPALKNGALFSLSFYSDSGILEYPNQLMQWADALAD